MNTAAAPFNGHSVSAAARDFLAARHGLLIDGQWRAATDGRTLVTEDPATGLALAEVALGGAADIELAVAAARRAFEGPWSRLGAPGRAACLLRLAALVRAQASTFTELEVLDAGMPRFIAGLTAANAAELFEYYAGAAWRIEGRTTIPPHHVVAEAEALTYTLREPVGVAALVVPWNVPLNMAAMKLAPALAAGCTVVLKPAEQTPLSALLLGRLALEAGIPPGVVNIVNGLGTEAGAALAAHPGVDKIAFTGSTATGRRIVQAALGNLKKVTLELGGKSPVVVMPDADLALAIPGVAMATFFLQGQNCMAGTRVLVHESVHDALLQGVAAFANAMTLGHGLDPATQQGPLVSAVQAARVRAYIEGAKAEGATCVAGGEALQRPGHFVRPTVFTDCRSDMTVVREEVFGPVMAVQRFATEDLDAIARLANDTPYGLSGSVWSCRLDTAHRLAGRIRAGQVSINCHGAVGSNIPFGGYKQSGWGREFGTESLGAFLETKAVTARL